MNNHRVTGPAPHPSAYPQHSINSAAAVSSDAGATPLCFYAKHRGENLGEEVVLGQVLLGLTWRWFNECYF